MTTTDKRVSLRLLECPARRFSGCGLVDIELGWLHNLTLVECDTCLSLGGPSSPDAIAYRIAYISSLLSTLLSNDLSPLSPSVLRALFLRHLPRDEALPLLEKHAPQLGHDTALSIASLLEAPPPFMARLRSSFMVSPPPLPSSHAPPRTFSQKVRSYLRAKISRITRHDVPLPILEQRRLSCFGDGQSIPPCPSLVRVKGLSFCASCGCARTEANRLCGENSKLALHPHLECPRARPGFSNPDGSVIPPRH